MYKNQIIRFNFHLPENDFTLSFWNIIIYLITTENTIGDTQLCFVTIQSSKPNLFLINHSKKLNSCGLGAFEKIVSAKQVQGSSGVPTAILFGLKSC